MKRSSIRKEGAAQAFFYDRRPHLRHVLVQRTCFLRRGEASEPCLVRTLSDQGMTARVFCDLQPGERVRVEFQKDALVGGEVLWAADWTFGLRFFEPFDVEAVLAAEWASETGKQPRPPRVSVNCPAKVQARGRISSGRVHDISEGGVKLETPRPLKADAKITLTVPGMPPMAGTVRWQQEGISGVAFDEALPPQVLQRWLADRVKGSARRG